MERVGNKHTRGGLKTYRRACYESISGIIDAEGWDTIDGYSARKQGWKTRNFKSIIAYQSRPTGHKIGFLKTAFNQGRICHYLNYYPPYFLARVATRTVKKYPFLSSLSMLFGYYSSIIMSQSRYEDEELLDYLRDEQKEILLKWIRNKA